MMINTAIKLLVMLIGILFLVTGLRWLLAPAGVAPDFGLALGSGIGLSSQVGDMSAFFLTLGVCMLTGLTTQLSVWYYPPIICSRSQPWVGTGMAIHDAALATQLIAPEVIVSLVLFCIASITKSGISA